MTVGFVTLTILDNGGSVVTVPTNSLQLVIAVSSSGTSYQPIATRSLATIENTFGYGPLVEASMLAINGGGNGLQGGTVIACKIPPNTHGNTAGVLQKTAASVSTITNATPAVVSTVSAHGFISGEVVTLAGVNVSAYNTTWVVTNISASTFSLNGSAGVGAASGGTATSTGVIFLGTGGTVTASTCVPTLTLDSTNGAWDDYYVQITITTGGTVATGPIAFTVSLDAGRNTGPIIQLGTATTYVIPNTGITINFTTAKTLTTGDYIRFATIAPTFSDANIQTAIVAVQGSPYANTGWGSTHIPGVFAGADGTTVEGYLDTLANGYLYTRAIIAARDAKVPTAWGGPGETETAWLTAIEADYAAVSAKRICANGGYYNMPSPTSAQGPAAPTVAYRRCLSWALAARQVGLPPQRNAGRVKDGSLGNIVVNPALDPVDGFVYHDERLNPSLNAARFSSATTRVPNTPGYFILEPNLMSPSGSQFAILPQGNVIDVGSSIFIQACNELINDDVRTNANGTIYANDALTQQSDILAPITANMTNAQVISGAQVVVDQTVNVQLTNSESINCTLDARGYVESIAASIGLAQPSTGINP